MANSPWLTLRQAREALRIGQPDEAHRLLAPLVAEGYRRAVKLSRDVAKAYLDRSERHLEADLADAAWLDLLAAEQLLPGHRRCTQMRQTLTRLGLAQCRAALEAGQPLTVIEKGVTLRERLVRDQELTFLEEAAQEWLLASDQADRGDFELARTTLGTARTRIAMTPLIAAGLDRFDQKIRERADRFRQAVAAINDSCESQRWETALQSADEALAAAPGSPEARRLRARAWEALQPTADTLPYSGNLADGMVALAVAAVGDGAASLPRAMRATPPTRGIAANPTRYEGAGPPPLPKRFLLWIDGVAGYLVCLNSRITFGQAADNGPVDVPLLAEVSRLHAELYRDAEGYSFESTREALVNGRPVSRCALKNGDRLTLGATCQLSFHIPVSISPTARLQLVSGHRLPQAVDGVLLMAENLILGPGDQVHVPMPQLPENLVIYRSKDGLGVRFRGEFKVDNQPCLNRAEMPLPSIVSADSFCFAVEPVGPRL